MAIIRKSEIKQMGTSQLQEKLNELEMELMKINAKISMGTTLESPGRVREVKKTRARILTKMNMDKKLGNNKDSKKSKEVIKKT